MLKNSPIVRSSVALMVITAVVKLLGYVEKVILAYYYGTGIEVDVYLLVFSLLFSIFVLFRELIEPGFLNVFLKIQKGSGEPEAWSFFNAFGQVLFIPVLVIFILGVSFPKEVIDIFAPGFDPAKKQLALKLVRLGFPAIIFLCMSNLTNIALNGQKKFILPAAGDVVFKAVIIIFLIVLYPRYGIAGAVMGITAGAAGKLLTHLAGLWKNIRFSKVRSHATHLKELWTLSWPLFVALLFGQANLLLDNVFASYMTDGTIAALGYSKKLVEMPILVFPYVLGIVVFPYFSHLSLENNTGKLSRLFYSSTGWIIFVFLPLSVFFFLFATPIVSVVFERGAFDAASTALTSKPLAIYSLGMLSFAIETVLVLVFFAMANTKTPTFVGIACVIINISVTLLLIPHIGYLSIPLALVISKSVKILTLLFLLQKKLRVDRQAAFSFLKKLFVAALVLCISLLAVQYLFSHYLPATNRKLVLIFSFIFGILVYTGCCFLLKMKPLLKLRVEV